jgi:hypothetical protein
MARVLSTLRTVGGRIRRRADPPSPPEELPDDLELLNRAPGDETFITGNGIASRCRWVLNYGPPRVSEAGREDWYFCKTDFVDYFFAHHVPDSDFVLFSHNSDVLVDAQLGRHLRHRRLRAWFATNVDLEHRKLHAIPIGIANPRWPHGDTEAVRRVQQESQPKTRLFDVSFSLGTNPAEREACADQTGLTPSTPQPFEQYLVGLASSYFSLSPRGNGIDTHRTWEALYLRTIPIVTRSVLTEQHRDLPLVVLDDWAEFRSIEFSPELYARVWGGWDPEAIRLDRYVERVAAVA